MITLVTGLPGSGKTYYAVRETLQALKEGRKVYSNVPMAIDSENLIHWTKLRNLLYLEKGLIVMDEAQVYLNARKWDTLPEWVQYKLQQHRKDGLDILAISQNINRIDVTMRELIGIFLECSKFFIGSREGSQNPWGWIFVRSYVDYTKKEKLGTDLITINKDTCDLYGSYSKVDQDEKRTLRHDEFRCPDCGFKKVVHTFE